jgi:hypothetical protein
MENTNGYYYGDAITVIYFPTNKWFVTHTPKGIAHFTHGKQQGMYICIHWTLVEKTHISSAETIK